MQRTHHGVKETHTKQILERLLNGGKITSLEAIDEYGCTRLSGRIYDIKHLGYPISDKMIEVPTRNGTTRVKEYWITPEQKTA